MLKYLFAFIFLFINYCIRIYAQNYCIENRFDAYLFDSTQTETISNILYGQAINNSGILEPLYLDLHKPVTETDTLEKLPLIIFIHGGSLKAGDKAEGGALFFGNDYAKRGFACATINYRLGWDEVPGKCNGDTTSLELALYRGIQDAKAAIRYLKEFADTFNIDTNYIFLAGFSVGSTIAMYSAYAKQQDFPQYLYDALGSIDSSGNAYYSNTANIKAISAKAAGIQYTNVLNNDTVPVIFFHGTCDNTVNYIEGPLFSCTEPVIYPVLFGSYTLNAILRDKGITTQLYTNEGFDHEAASNDTVAAYSSQFFKSIFCNNAESETYYRFNNGGCLVSGNGEITFEYYPNPFVSEININVTASFEGNIFFELINEQGEIVYRTGSYFTPPISNFTLQLNQYTLAHGMYFLRVSNDTGVTQAEMLFHS